MTCYSKMLNCWDVWNVHRCANAPYCVQHAVFHPTGATTASTILEMPRLPGGLRERPRDLSATSGDRVSLELIAQ